MKIFWGLRRLGSIPFKRKLVYLEALWNLFYYRGLVAITPNRRLSQTLVGKGQVELASALSFEQAKQLVVPFEQIYSSFGGKLACVPTALAVQSYLRKKGVSSELKFGARFNLENQEMLEAHCWVEHAGQPIWGRSNPEEIYAILQSR